MSGQSWGINIDLTLDEEVGFAIISLELEFTMHYRLPLSWVNGKWSCCHYRKQYATQLPNQIRPYTVEEIAA
jgi:hypothetical protein